MNATVGREPPFVHAASGTATVPVTTFAFPLASVETYRTFHAFIGTSPGMFDSTASRHASRSPGSPWTVDGGAA
ncbi:hypothetical protein [Actinomadura sp. WMMB 499]|uniref:hypothetical protein n=1 Tax=Actinomadura sp. WMMB 499 TaxID=1219491 RepID=UPI0020C782B6|nr:hypothetical protein [Actinomadura sp. WMMB 499]